MESGYFPITQTFGSVAICLDATDIAWVHGEGGHFCIGETAADSNDAIAACQRPCSTSMQQREVWSARRAACAEARASLKGRDEIFPKAGRSSRQGAERFLGFYHHMEKQMTKVTFVSAALIAAAVFTTQAMAARSDVTARHATAKAHTSVTGCVRAPDVGAFASDPYTVPPCMPNTNY